MTPPSAPLAGEIQNPDASQWEEKLNMDENIAIQCLEDYIDENCCWGKGPLKKMKIISVEPSMAFKVLNKSFSINFELAVSTDELDGKEIHRMVS